MVNKLLYKINTFHKYEYLFYFFFFIFIGLYLNLNDYVELATNDDRTLWDLLVNGEKGTLILSYPLSSVFVKLYEFFPHVQWYSLLLTVLMLINSFSFALYMSMQKQTETKISLFILFSIFLINYWINLSITLLTVSLLVTALLFIQQRFILFISILITASFLRTGIVITLSPLLILSIILLYKFPFKKPHILLMVLFFSILAINQLTPKINKEYSDWLSFNKAKSYFIDLRKNDQHNILTPEQNNLLKFGWWIQDEELLPSKQLIQSAGSKLIVLKDSVETFRIEFFKTHRYTYLMYLLITAMLIIGFIRKKYLLIYMVLFSATMFVIFTKDVERTTMPLLFMLIATIIVSLNHIKHTRFASFISCSFLISSILILLQVLPGQFSNRSKYYNEIKPLKEEFLNLLHQSGKQCEISINFPTSFHLATNVLMGNKLFDEKNWISFKYTSLLPTGWLSRHPFFYTSHQISTENINRKYKNYYEFLMSEDTGFIGSNIMFKSHNASNILHMYDKKYNGGTLCQHETVIINRSKNFAVSKIQNNCHDQIILLSKHMSDRTSYISHVLDTYEVNTTKSIFDIKTDNNKLVTNRDLTLVNKTDHIECNFISFDPILALKNLEPNTEYVLMRLQIESEINTKLQLFYKKSPSKNYNETDSYYTYIVQGENELNLIIPSEFLRNNLRIDLSDRVGKYKIYNFQMWDIRLQQKSENDIIQKGKNDSIQ